MSNPCLLEIAEKCLGANLRHVQNLESELLGQHNALADHVVEWASTVPRGVGRDRLVEICEERCHLLLAPILFRLSRGIPPRSDECRDAAEAKFLIDLVNEIRTGDREESCAQLAISTA